MLRQLVDAIVGRTVFLYYLHYTHLSSPEMTHLYNSAIKSALNDLRK